MTIEDPLQTSVHDFLNRIASSDYRSEIDKIYASVLMLDQLSVEARRAM